MVNHDAIPIIRRTREPFILNEHLKQIRRLHTQRAISPFVEFCAEYFLPRQLAGRAFNSARKEWPEIKWNTPILKVSNDPWKVAYHDPVDILARISETAPATIQQHIEVIEFKKFGLVQRLDYDKQNRFFLRCGYSTAHQCILINTSSVSHHRDFKWQI